jgi:hypothetical protein
MKDFWDLYDHKKTFVENLHKIIGLRGYEFGKDYMEVDLGNYIAFCPFKFEILKGFPGLFRHCVTVDKTHWDAYFKSYFYGWGDLKTFFFRKDTNIHKINDVMWEFTCWLNVRQCQIGQNKHSLDSDLGDNFHNFHNYDNCLMSKCNRLARPIIEDNYDKIVKCFMQTEVYKNLIPSKL